MDPYEFHPDQPGPRGRTAPQSRVKVRAGCGGALGREARHTHVELPFTEATPSMAPPTSTVYDLCCGVLDGLTPHQRDVALANLLVKYGERV